MSTFGHPMLSSYLPFMIALLAVSAGGVVKGAIGAGAPVVAIPIIAAVFDVPTAVTVMAVPNLLSNIWQGWAFRTSRLPWAFTGVFAVAGLAGAAAGTLLLVNLPSQLLALILAIVVFAYIIFRISRPGWVFPYAVAKRYCGPVGFIGGVLQGAAGLSAPVSVTYLSAMRLDRSVFIATISIFFVAMSASQIPLLVAYGKLTSQWFMFGLLAFGILFASMPLGGMLARRLPREAFDRLILVMLGLVGLRLLYSAIS